MAELRKTLSDSREGRSALELADRYGTEATFEKGAKTTNDVKGKKLTLDSDLTPEEKAVRFVGAMSQARNEDEGCALHAVDAFQRGHQGIEAGLWAGGPESDRGHGVLCALRVRR